MFNKEVFVEKLNESGEVKYEMSEIHSRILGQLKCVYQYVFKREKRDFLSLKNMMYFKTGIASPDARAKLHDLLNIFVSLVNHYDFLADDELKEYLLVHGVEVNIVQPSIQDGPIVVSKEETKKFERAWKFAMANQAVPETKKELLNEILDKSISIQRTIENKKQEIEKNAEEVDLECQVKKPYFFRALGIKLKELEKRSVDNEIKKVEDDIAASQDIISVFDTDTEKQDEE